MFKRSTMKRLVPYFGNSIRGHQKKSPARHRTLSVECLEQRTVLSADVYISEFLASNSGGLEDGDGDSPDWIELYNAGTSSADLSGHYLTDDSADLTKWAFPAGTTIAPKATLIVFASDKGSEGPIGELHTNWKLSTDGEYLGLIEPDAQTVIHEYAPTFPPQTTNISYGLSMETSKFTLVDDTTAMRYHVPANAGVDGVWRNTSFDDSVWSIATAAIGYETNSGSGTAYSSLIDATVATGTTSAYTRFSFEVTAPESLDALWLEMLYDDGFVAYLNGELIRSENAPATPAWNSTAGSVNRPDEEVLDAYVRYDVSGYLDLLVAGQNVLAIHALNQASSSDMLMIPRLVASSTDIVMPQVAGYFSQSTPGAPNGETLLGVVADTKFSVDRGFYSEPFLVEITTDTTDATVVYTTDGSVPAVDENLAVTNGTLYTGPISIAGTTNLRAAAFKQGYAPTNIDTQTYFFTSDIITQTYLSAIDAGFPSSWRGTAADYGLDPDVIGPGDLFGGVYASQIESSLTAIPSLSLTLNRDDFFGPSGIYANPTGAGIDWERATSAELIYPDGEVGFQIDAGVRIHGGASRTLTKKHSLRLLFKSEYGDAKLDYPWFGEDGVDEFDTIVLRPHFNDGWGWGGENGDVDSSFIRDRWFRDTQAAMGHASSRGSLVHLYVNGLYWGLYNPSERPDDSFAAETFGGEKQEYDVVNHDGLHEGSLDAYNTMIGLTQQVDSASSEASRTEAYFELQGKLADGSVDPHGDVWLDMVNYIDYMVLNHYGGNNDWPNRNWFAIRRRGDESEGFRFFAWDSEIALDLSSRTSLFENNLGQSSGAAEAYGSLLDSEEFRLAFADRVHQHLFNDGALYVNPDNPAYDPLSPQDNVPASRFAALAETVYEPLVAESARWGDQHTSFPRTRDNEWQTEMDYMLGFYFQYRHDVVLEQWVAAGLYPETAAPEFLVDDSRQHGGEVTAGAALGFEDPNTGTQGTIYYTTDGTDPRLVGGALNTASATAFTGSFGLPEGSTLVKARVLLDGEWSALTEASFDAISSLPDNADFNQDGIVNLADYTLWRNNLGNTGDTQLPGDADHNHVVDNGDYLIWKDQFGTLPSSFPVAAAIASTSAPWLVTNASTGPDTFEAKSMPEESPIDLRSLAGATSNPGVHHAPAADGQPTAMVVEQAFMASDANGQDQQRESQLPAFSYLNLDEESGDGPAQVGNFLHVALDLALTNWIVADWDSSFPDC